MCMNILRISLHTIWQKFTVSCDTKKLKHKVKSTYIKNLISLGFFSWWKLCFKSVTSDVDLSGVRLQSLRMHGLNFKESSKWIYLVVIGHRHMLTHWSNFSEVEPASQFPVCQNTMTWGFQTDSQAQGSWFFVGELGFLKISWAQIRAGIVFKFQKQANKKKTGTMSTFSIMAWTAYVFSKLFTPIFRLFTQVKVHSRMLSLHKKVSHVIVSKKTCLLFFNKEAF